jgi:hypothetical protein
MFGQLVDPVDEHDRLTVRAHDQAGARVEPARASSRQRDCGEEALTAWCALADGAERLMVTDAAHRADTNPRQFSRCCGWQR